MAGWLLKLKPGRLILFLTLLLSRSFAEEPRSSSNTFQAGAAAVDVTPEKLPVWVSGGFLARKTGNVNDRLYSRALVLDDGATRLVLVVVDSLMMTRDLLDPVKEEASRKTGVPPDRMMICATHTHSAPSVMGALGTPVDAGYARFLPQRIVESIVQANEQLEPARVGWAVVKDYEHNHCRRWVFRPDRMGRDPFGNVNVRAMMHPGHQSPNHVGPAGPADKGLSLLAVQSRDARPIAVLANYAMHYKGSAPISADVCGRFGAVFARLIGAERSRPPFVGMLSQGTSGDSMWMDYSSPRRDPGLEGYTRELAQTAHRAYETIDYRDWVSLAMAEARLTLRRRTPDEKRLTAAKAMAERIKDRLPQDRSEVYALEAVYLHEKPEVELKLQAIRVGKLGIATFPNEVYGITGLKIKARSPLSPTFNIELANGAQGYIPPPEQHALGGYTTWPARSAGLEVDAEPRIVEALLTLLEEVSERDRVQREVPLDDYLREVEKSKPEALWRLDELAGAAALDASGNGHHAAYEAGVALFLPGRGPSDLKDAEMTAHRAAHFAGGRVRVALDNVDSVYSLEMWFWNGLPLDARRITGHLFAIGSVKGKRADQLAIGGVERSGVLIFSNGAGTELAGKTPIALRVWNHVVVVRDGRRVAVHLNGNPEPEIRGELDASLSATGTSDLVLGGRQDGTAGLEGKLDDVAHYARALSASEILDHYKASGLRPPRPGRIPATAPVHPIRPSSPADVARYAGAVRASRPLAWWTLLASSDGSVPDATGNHHLATLEPGASAREPGADLPNFNGGRLKAVVKGLGPSYSVELWFSNELPVTARPVTGYFFSRGPDLGEGAPGEHLGIGGTHTAKGRLIVFNGNARNQVLEGTTRLPLRSWNHVVLTRSGERVRVYLNGKREPEIDGDLQATFARDEEVVFVGARNDRFAPFQGQIDQVAVYGRPLTAAEIEKHFQARVSSQ